MTYSESARTLKAAWHRAKKLDGFVGSLKDFARQVIENSNCLAAHLVTAAHIWLANKKNPKVAQAIARQAKCASRKKAA